MLTVHPRATTLKITKLTRPSQDFMKKAKIIERNRVHLYCTLMPSNVIGFSEGT